MGEMHLRPTLLRRTAVYKITHVPGPLRIRRSANGCRKAPFSKNGRSEMRYTQARSDLTASGGVVSSD